MGGGKRGTRLKNEGFGRVLKRRLKGGEEVGMLVLLVAVNPQAWA